MAPTPTSPQTGITVSTSITADGTIIQHAEGIVVSTPIIAGGLLVNHAEVIVASTWLTG